MGCNKKVSGWEEESSKSIFRSFALGRLLQIMSSILIICILVNPPGRGASFGVGLMGLSLMVGIILESNDR